MEIEKAIYEGNNIDVIIDGDSKITQENLEKLKDTNE